MQFLLTFLAAIASLSASALVRVHAVKTVQTVKCAVCPSAVVPDYARKCYHAGEKPSTICYYKNNGESVATDHCRYDVDGLLVGKLGVPDCPREVAMGTGDCPPCT